MGCFLGDVDIRKSSTRLSFGLADTIFLRMGILICLYDFCFIWVMLFVKRCIDEVKLFVLLWIIYGCNNVMVLVFSISCSMTLSMSFCRIVFLVLCVFSLYESGRCFLVDNLFIRLIVYEFKFWWMMLFFECKCDAIYLCEFLMNVVSSSFGT